MRPQTKIVILFLWLAFPWAGQATLRCGPSFVRLALGVPKIPSATAIKAILDYERYPSRAKALAAMKRYGMAQERPKNPRTWIWGIEGKLAFDDFRRIAYGDENTDLPIVTKSAMEGLRRVVVKGTNHDEMWEGVLLGVPVVVKVDIVQGKEGYIGQIYETAVGQLFNKLGEGPVVFGLMFLADNKIGTVMEKVDGVRSRDLSDTNADLSEIRNWPAEKKARAVASLKRIKSVFTALGVFQNRESELEYILTPEGDAVPIDFGGQRIPSATDTRRDIESNQRTTEGTFDRALERLKGVLGVR